MAFTVSPSDFLTTYFIGKNMPGGTVQFLYPINPYYCLSDTAAANLKTDLADMNPTEVRIAPLGSGWGGMYVQGNLANPDNTVPWLQFKGASGGAVLFNSGVLANNYARGYDPAYAETLTRGQIQAAMANG
jgi:hypothetical protein